MKEVDHRAVIGWVVELQDHIRDHHKNKSQYLNIHGNDGKVLFSEQGKHKQYTQYIIDHKSDRSVHHKTLYVCEVRQANYSRPVKSLKQKDQQETRDRYYPQQPTRPERQISLPP